MAAVPAEAVELRLDVPSDAAVRNAWQALLAAGLPSQSAHRNPASNAPHVTLASASVFTDVDAGRIAERIRPVLPATVRVAGTVLFGRRRTSVGWLLEPGAALADAARAVRGSAASAAHGSAPQLADADADAPGLWLPHLTLALRAPAATVPHILDVLADVEVPATVTLDRLMLWHPGPRTLLTLVGPQDRTAQGRDVA